MHAAQNFLKAYGRFEEKQPLLDKVVSDLSVNLVMHVVRKNAGTRENYAGVPEILHEFYNECKSVDPSLPNWTKLPALPNADDKKRRRNKLKRKKHA